MSSIFSFFRHSPSPFVLCAALFIVNTAYAQTTFDAEGTLWAPFIEWEITNPTFDINPFDVLSTVTFTHNESGSQHSTQMFYTGDATWKWRFAGTETGTWTFVSTSDDPDLHGLQGTVTIAPGHDVYGFMTQHASATHNKWARPTGANGDIEAFIPQFVMFDSNPANFYNNPEYIDASINEFMGTHGFTGFHLAVIGARWFDMDAPENALSGNETDPDPRTFDALELLITKTHAAGGVVHIWPWGDASRDQVPLELDGGANGPLDERLQRYIAARLGPIPGWSMGYGFDLFEWTNESMLETWHANMQSFLGWPHFLGGRAHKNQLSQIYEGFDYSAYEWHRPTYQDYLDHSTTRPAKPAFSEDRFRIRNRDKDYTMEETRRGLWHSALGGGVANIWGNLRNENGSIAEFSNPYPNPEWIKTYALFWQDRFLKDMEPCNTLTDAYCLGDPTLESYVLYKEDTEQIEITFSNGNGGMLRPVMVVDTKNPYAELGPCEIPAEGFTWTLPYASDWAIAIGTFGQDNPTGSFDCSTLPVELNQFDATSDGPDILLTWNTASELNNAGFEVQYKTADTQAYEVYTFIEGQGTSTTGTSYSTRLQDVTPGSYTFRLKQIDFDGTFAFSDQITHLHESVAPFSLTKAYPTPFQERTTLSVSVSRSQHIKAILYDSLGREVQTIFDDEVDAHIRYPIHIDAGSLPNGSYFVQITGEYFHSSERVVLLR